MRAGEWLRAAEREPMCGLEAFPGAGEMLILAPHPDDESLGCGGLIAALVADGRRVRVVVVSDGAGSHPGSRAWPPERLASLRRREVLRAVAALGLDPRNVDFLGLPDGSVPAWGENFSAAAAAILNMGPGPAAVFATWRHDPHADHRASFAIAAAVARALPSGVRLFAYPVWGQAFAHPVPGFPLPAEPDAAPLRAIRLDIARHLPAKRRAIAAHRSQTTGLIADVPGGFRIPPEMLALADRPFELFLEEPV